MSAPRLVLANSNAYEVSHVDGTQSVVAVRTSHWLKLERAIREDKLDIGPLEQTLRVIHFASGIESSFDDWVDTVADWNPVQEDDDVPPSEGSPAPSPD